jgi:WD40 repeat protein
VIYHFYHIWCWFSSVAYSPDSKHIVSGSYNNTIRIWDAETELVLMKPLQDHGQSDTVFPGNAPVLMSHHGRGSFSRLKHTNNTAFFDPNAFCNHSKLDNGWVYGPDGKSCLFWVPPQNRGGLFWPRTKAVIGALTTQIDFSRFVHGEDWWRCQSLE